MNFSSFIARRIAFNRQQSFSRFIIRLATAATILSVAIMILSMGITNGFQYTISQKIFSFWGHMRVQHYEAVSSSVSEELPIVRNDTVEQLLSADPHLQSYHRYASKSAILKTPETLEGIVLKGVEKTYRFPTLQAFLQQGRWMDYPDSGYSNDIVLSSYTAHLLKLKVNDPVIIYFVQNDGSLPRARKLKVAGIYKTGIEEYDKVIALGDIRLIRRLNGWKSTEIGGYEVLLKDYHQMEAVSEKLYSQLPEGWNCRTIREINPNIFDWLNLQNTTVVLVLVIMTVVALLNLVTCLIILVLERTRMVGVLKALGAPNGKIQLIFLYHGGIITLTGILIGNLLALILSWLQQHYGFIRLPEEMYYIARAEIRLEFWHFAVVDLMTFLVCFCVLLIPTLIIRRIQPVRAIQFS